MNSIIQKEKELRSWGLEQSGSKPFYIMICPQSNFENSKKSLRDEHTVIMPTEKGGQFRFSEKFPLSEVPRYLILGAEVSAEMENSR